MLKVLKCEAIKEKMHLTCIISFDFFGLIYENGDFLGDLVIIKL